MNWAKIWGNFLVAFATSFAAASWVGGINAFSVAAINAIIFGALAVGKELQAECGEDGNKLTKVLSKAVLL